MSGQVAAETKPAGATDVPRDADVRARVDPTRLQAPRIDRQPEPLRDSLDAAARDLGIAPLT
jgi:hypothetical protein